MTVKGRRQEYAEVTRAAIVDAAVERFTMEGYARTSIDAVAEAARVTKGGVYHHFSDKAELFEAAFIAMEERLLAAVEAGIAGLTDPWDLIAAGIEIYLEECCTPDFRRIALQDAPGARSAGTAGSRSRSVTSFRSWERRWISSPPMGNFSLQLMI